MNSFEVQYFEEAYHSNDIKKLNDQMKKWDYGYISKGKRYTGKEIDKDGFKSYKLMSPEKVEKYKIGTCWDYTSYEDYWFKKHNIPHQCWYFQANRGDNHSWLSYKENGKVIAFEASWKSYAGLHVYNNEDEMLKDYISRSIKGWKAETGTTVKVGGYFVTKFNQFNIDGMDPYDYMYKVTKYGTFVKGDRDIYISWKDNREMLQESTSFISTTMYHGSDIKLSVLKPTAYNAGHRLKKHSWSVFMWPTYDLAYDWAVFKAVNNIIRPYHRRGELHRARGNHISTGFNKYKFVPYLLYSEVDRVKELCRGKATYVYTIDCPIDTKFGIGNNNMQPEYTYDGELRIKKTTKIIINDDVIDKVFDYVSMEDYEGRAEWSNHKNIRGPIGLVFYPGKELIGKWAYSVLKIETGESNYGDDPDEMMKDYSEEDLKRLKQKVRQNAVKEDTDMNNVPWRIKPEYAVEPLYMKALDEYMKDNNLDEKYRDILIEMHLKEDEDYNPDDYEDINDLGLSEDWIVNEYKDEIMMDHLDYDIDHGIRTIPERSITESTNPKTKEMVNKIFKEDTNMNNVPWKINPEYIQESKIHNELKEAIKKGYIDPEDDDDPEFLLALLKLTKKGNE